MLKLNGHRSAVRALAFAPDGMQLASVAGREQRVSLWSLPGATRELSPGPATRIQALAFDPSDGAVVFAAGRCLGRWGVSAGAVGVWRRTANDGRHVAFTTDGALLAVACYPLAGYTDFYRVDLFPPDPAVKKTFLRGDYGAPYCMAFSADGHFLAAGGENRTLCVGLPHYELLTVSAFVAKPCGITEAIPCRPCRSRPSSARCLIRAGRRRTSYTP